MLCPKSRYISPTINICDESFGVGMYTIGLIFMFRTTKKIVFKDYFSAGSKVLLIAFIFVQLDFGSRVQTPSGPPI